MLFSKGSLDFLSHSLGKRILLVFYINNLVFIGDDVQGIDDLKSHLQLKFQIWAVMVLSRNSSCYIQGVDLAFLVDVYIGYVVRSSYVRGVKL